jgi:hypothetical protein
MRSSGGRQLRQPQTVITHRRGLRATARAYSWFGALASCIQLDLIGEYRVIGWLRNFRSLAENDCFFVGCQPH